MKSSGSRGHCKLYAGTDSGRLPIRRAVAIAYAREGAQVAVNYLPEEDEDAFSLDGVFSKEGIELKLVPGDITLARVRGVW